MKLTSIFLKFSFFSLASFGLGSLSLAESGDPNIFECLSTLRRVTNAPMSGGAVFFPAGKGGIIINGAVALLLDQAPSDLLEKGGHLNLESKYGKQTSASFTAKSGAVHYLSGMDPSYKSTKYREIDDRNFLLGAIKSEMARAFSAAKSDKNVIGEAARECTRVQGLANLFPADWIKDRDTTEYKAPTTDGDDWLRGQQ